MPIDVVRGMNPAYVREAAISTGIVQKLQAVLASTPCTTVLLRQDGAHLTPLFCAELERQLLAAFPNACVRVDEPVPLGERAAGSVYYFVDQSRATLERIAREEQAVCDATATGLAEGKGQAGMKQTVKTPDVYIYVYDTVVLDTDTDEGGAKNEP